MTITAEITNIQPDTRYQDTTYENRVIITRNGTTFGVFDPDMHTDQSMIGHSFELDILPFLPFEIDTSVGRQPGVIPNPENQTDYLDHTFCGEIIKVTEGWPKWLTLDIGSGTVRIEFYEDPPDHIEYKEELKDIDSGDSICVTVSRTDLHAVK